MEMERVIDKFDGDFGFLSNFSPHSFRASDDVKWLTVEHFYQAMKAVDMVDRGVIWSAGSPGEAKRLGQTVKLREDWDIDKFEIMQYAVDCKFEQNQHIQEKLMTLKDYTLIEGNHWHDNIWGDCKCDKCANILGQNWLGKLLMEIRDDYLL